MASTSGSNNADLIQGLNLIHPPPTPTANSDASDILSAGPYSDLSAQLDLWTNVHFASDEPFVAGQDPNNNSNQNQDQEGGEKKTGDGHAGEVIKKKRDLLAGKKAQSHLNQSVAQSRPASSFNTATMAATNNNPPFDLSALFGAPSGTATVPAQFHPQAMNINQLLAMQAFPNPFQAAAAFGGVSSFPPPAQVAFPPPTTPTTASLKAEPAAKRSKTNSRKNSASTTTTTSPPQRRSSTTAPSEAASRTERSQSPVGDDDGDENEQGQQRPNAEPSSSSLGESSLSLSSSKGGSSGSGGGTAEDKRRRNTQASARFRLKKKEREHAMESRSKELETKVSELEKECEALRRENGWLKGLVVGVTGGTGMPVTMPTGPILAPLTSHSHSHSSSSSKRKRGDGNDQ